MGKFPRPASPVGLPGLSEAADLPRLRRSGRRAPEPTTHRDGLRPGRPTGRGAGDPDPGDASAVRDRVGGRADGDGGRCGGRRLGRRRRGRRCRAGPGGSLRCRPRGGAARRRSLDADRRARRVWPALLEPWPPLDLGWVRDDARRGRGRGRDAGQLDDMPAGTDLAQGRMVARPRNRGSDRRRLGRGSPYDRRGGRGPRGNGHPAEGRSAPPRRRCARLGRGPDEAGRRRLRRLRQLSVRVSAGNETIGNPCTRRLGIHRWSADRARSSSQPGPALARARERRERRRSHGAMDRSGDRCARGRWTDPAPDRPGAEGRPQRWWPSNPRHPGGVGVGPPGNRPEPAASAGPCGCRAIPSADRHVARHDAGCPLPRVRRARPAATTAT